MLDGEGGKRNKGWKKLNKLGVGQLKNNRRGVRVCGCPSVWVCDSVCVCGSVCPPLGATCCIYELCARALVWPETTIVSPSDIGEITEATSSTLG